MEKRLICLGACITVTAFILAFALIYTGIVPLAPTGNRPLATMFLESTFNAEKWWIWAGSPEVVTSILWDYRGIDTVYETTVFFLAIIGAITVVRTMKLLPETSGKGKGLTVIAKTITKITFAAIPIIAFSIAVHGHLTPGGGFQAGSAFAVAPLLVIAALSLRLLVERGWEKERLLALRTTGLILIGIIAIIVPVLAILRHSIAYIMQNQAKLWAPAGLSAIVNVFGIKSLLSGTLFWLNLSEFLAVSAGLSLVFVLLAAPTKNFDKEVKVQ